MSSEVGGRQKSSSASELLSSRRGPKSHVPWRERYKQRCLERMKKRRFETLFRQGLSTDLHGVVEEDLEEESAADGSTMSFGGPLQRQSSSPDLPQSVATEAVATAGAAMDTVAVERGMDVSSTAVASGGDARPGLDNVMATLDNAMATRDLVRQAMTDEWAATKELGLLAVPDNQLPFLPTFDPSEVPADDVSELCSLMEELEEEMRAEEAAMLARYRDRQALSEEDLCSALEHMSTDELLCPICSKNYLMQNLSVIFCQCGLRIDTEQDGVNMQFLKRQFQVVTDEHGCRCSAKPQFVLQSLDGRADVQNLLLTCDQCDIFSIVL